MSGYLTEIGAGPYWVWLAAAMVLAAAGAAFAADRPGGDWRNIRNGLEIPSEGYADQPYVVVTKDGHWLCVLTTGRGKEGDRGQHVVATLSADKGRTWSKLIDIEPADGPEASWVMPLITPSGRVYAFYDYNGDNITGRRADMLGWYCWRYSDDGGRTWSAKRYRLPVRLTDADRRNDFAGRAQIFWGIGKPIVSGGSAIFAFSKIGKYLISDSEGWFFRSDNVLTERDPEKVVWRMLPDGERGLRAEEHGPVQAEQNIVALSGGGLFCMYRTVMGYPCCSYSRDGGRTWTKPAPATCTPGGRRLKHPRACPRIWRTKEGRYLFWFHNHGGKDFTGRNPAWVCGGVEVDGQLHWSQPEILLYDEDPLARMSYPDLIEQDGRTWVTETQKTTARVHEIDPALLEGLWRQGETRTVAKEGLALSLSGDKLPTGQAAMPPLPDLATAGGFTIDVWLTPSDLADGQIVLDSRDDAGRGVAITTTKSAALRLDMGDGRRSASWSCDPRLLKVGRRHHVVFLVDGGPKIISVLVDGQLCDGGSARQYGWGRFSRPKKDKENLGDVTGSRVVKIAPSLKGEVHSLRIYTRCLRTSEAVGNFNAGCS